MKNLFQYFSYTYIVQIYLKRVATTYVKNFFFLSTTFKNIKLFFNEDSKCCNLSLNFHHNIMSHITIKIRLFSFFDYNFLAITFMLSNNNETNFEPLFKT